jgi:hypothetical protein
MLEEFNPIWQRKIRSARPGKYALSAKEIERVVNGANYPGNR